MKNLIAISSLILVISSCTTPGQVQQESEDRFNSMTTESIELCTSVTGQGDPLETIITFSTKSCYTTENGILRMKWNDQFIRGYVSKTSKSITSLQVYNVIYTRQGTWIYPYQANYLINDKLITDDGVDIASDVDCSSSDLYNSCLYKNDYGFDLDLEVFDEARRLKSNGEQLFNYRIKTKAGGDINRVFNVEEILGLESKMKRIIEGL
jgi:hypothetical protein